MTRLVTFFMGFYVSMIARRWWDQVSKLPDAEVICLALGGLVWTKEESKTASRQAGLHFKKTIARYALLSWSMCLAKVSSRLKTKLTTAKDYIEKGLLTENEALILKVQNPMLLELIMFF